MHQGKEESIWEMISFLFAIKMGMSPYARQTGWVKNKNNIHGCQLLLIFFVSGYIIYFLVRSAKIQ